MSRVIPFADRVARLPVAECGESLCDLREVPAIRLDERGAGADVDFAYAYLRRSLVDRLVAAQTLLPTGARLLVIEGFRPLSKQRWHFDQHCAQLSVDHPEWTVERVRQQAARHVDPPELEPHVTGGTVDLTICAEDGTTLPMGPLPALPCGTGAMALDGVGPTPVTRVQRANRQHLGTALRAVGLVNSPTAWWHWSYGDRYWAFVTGRPAARYGPLTA